MNQEIPVLDFKSPTLAQQIGLACQSCGFFYLKNHGVDDLLISRMLDGARAFFALPMKEKMQIRMENANSAWRGYFPLGEEKTSGKPDHKEGIYFGREDSQKVSTNIPLVGQNQFPQHPELKSLVLTYMATIETLSREIMRAISRDLLDESHENYFEERFTMEPTTLFRIFNYPGNNNEWGVREHTDYGFLTILLQDGTDGLEVKHRETQAWMKAPSIPNALLINIGDMLEYWTHGLYKAGPHRVKNLSKKDRISCPYFYDPGYFAPMTPIDKRLLLRPVVTKNQPSALRWDGLESATAEGFAKANQHYNYYGEYLWAKVSRVFPELAKQVGC